MTKIARQRLLSFETPRLIPFSPQLWGYSFGLMKLLPARFMLDRAEDRGELQPGGHIVETTSGTFGMALAMLAAARAYRLTLVTADSLIDEAFEHRLKLLGANVVMTRDPQSTGNQQARLQVLADLRAADPTAFWPNQYANHDNPLSYATVAQQIIRELGPVDRIVASVGSGGSLSGMAKFLKLANPSISVVAVDTHGSVLFGQPPGGRKLRGMGNSIVPANLRHDLVDEVHWIGADLARQSMFWLYRRHGIYAGPTSGAAFLVADWFSRTDPDARTVFLLPDEGHRYINTAYAIDPASITSMLLHRPLTVPTVLSTITAGSDGDWFSYAWSGRALSDVIAAN